MEYAIIGAPVVPIYEVPAAIRQEDGRQLSTIADEALYGMEVCITGAEENGCVPVLTHYHYAGFIEPEKLVKVSLKQLQDWENSNLYVVDAILADVTTVADVDGHVLTSLPKGALIEVLVLDTEHAWSQVRLVTGETGYIRRQFLQPKRFSQAGLWQSRLPQTPTADEAEFRQAVIAEARKYLGVQYRWGGKSTMGLDCSGLTFMCYMLQGVLIYRDAAIKEGFPIREIPLADKKPGDLLFFPGHIAIYMGNNRYIHSTGKAGSGGVVINSFDPKDFDYREDLDKNIYAAGSLFA